MTKLLEHPITLVIASVLFVLFFYSLRQTGNKTEQSSQEIAVLEEKAYQASKEVQSLQEELEQSKSAEYKERIVRDELLLQKEGEYIVQLAVPEIEVIDTDITTTKTQSNQEKWLEILF
ncbi:MAG: hypothetical protein GW762_00670 [Candidatus Pacebacteria bacterium]|nr:hypothetical protein [Candidatus Paceibacterota bacterium]PIR63709.1 MAG: hypothetical protein COU64_03170 [Candidatus Pacebacteria bacterium CG10_big_fil_rev_8_21_14_0_10_40_26]PIZ79712.1 MAG: hypothetical protein COY01_00210 [Candidatus Pacebacteria bacterium CG_4_10_14_0_2_um_filter_40_20]PJA68356.1 MAG: hypothetical protein CO156_05165 [Candidatus Pacebacteria bacterium CG_4_9_14_3_um_filter_40_12]PJC41218.1 MAG: hypothetical protein CO041_05235 [Candidatus Pacebacteria bacterium CG_4_9_